MAISRAISRPFRVLLAVVTAALSSDAASIGISLFDDLKCTKGEKVVDFAPSPLCIAGDTMSSVRYLTSGAGDFVHVGLMIY